MKNLFSHVPMVFLCKFCQNPTVGSGDRVQTRLSFTVFIVWWPWKLGQGHQNLIKSQRYNIWSLARVRHLVQEIGCRQPFLVKIWKFYSFYSVVTLNIRSRSPKSNQTFKPPQRYNIWSLARIRHLPVVQEIWVRTSFFGQNLKISKCWCDLVNDDTVIKI